jgi:small-conductance mechanosensitive channel
MPSLLLAAPAQEAAQRAACGAKSQQAWLCTTVYRITGNKDAAEVADALAKPLRIVFVLLVAFVVARIVRRTIVRFARHLGEKGRSDRLRLGSALPPMTDHERRGRAQRIATLGAVVANAAVLAVWTIAGLMVIGELGIDLAPLLAGAGVITVVIGFGAQTVVRDYLAGVFMVLEDQYSVGDVIDIDGTSGTVEWISLRVTRLRDVEGVVWWVPNGVVTKLGNKSQQWSRALLDIAVAGDTDIDRAIEVIQETADAMWHEETWRHAILDEPEVWGVEAIEMGSVVVRLVVKTVPLEQWNVARELRARLKKAFEEAGIDMPVPQQRITYRSLGDGVPPFTGDAGAS